eukprot:7646704-Pyramimonas_sp.AAC.1
MAMSAKALVQPTVCVTLSRGQLRAKSSALRPFQHAAARQQVRGLCTTAELVPKVQRRRCAMHAYHRCQ